MICTLGVATIKQLYFYSRNKNELDMRIEDYMAIGATSGVFVSQVVLGGPKFLFIGGALGTFYGLFYSAAGVFLINRRNKLAEKIGISL
jgi:hypothetical protein